MSDQPQSPCVSLCRLETDDDGNEICIGCYRTVDEVINWASMSDEQKWAVLERINHPQIYEKSK